MQVLQVLIRVKMKPSVWNQYDYSTKCLYKLLKSLLRRDEFNIVAQVIVIVSKLSLGNDWIIYLQKHILPIKIAYKFFKVHLMAWAVWDPTGIRDVFGPKSDFGQHFFYITSSRMEDDSCFMKYQKPLFYSIILHLMFSHYQDIQVIESVSNMEHSQLNGE